MRPNLTWMMSQFVSFNQRYFQRRLPLPAFRLSKARTFLGNMKWKENRLKHKYFDYQLTMSEYYDLEEHELQSVMLHEMIHYFIAFNYIKDTSPHGKVFCSIMDKLNACGWNIRISHHSTENGESSTARKTYRPGRRLIGVFIMKQEIYYAVINPGYVGRIVSGMFSTPDFRELKWYVSNDDYFKQFPLIRSLRGYKINNEKLKELEKIMSPVVLKEGMMI